MSKHFLCVLAVAVSLVFPSLTQAQDVSFRARLIDQHLTNVMRGAEIATMAIGEALISSDMTNEAFHDYLNRMKTQLPEARAILVIGPDGKLMHDSFTFPTLDLDLSAREYFSNSIELRGESIYIGTAKIGKSSGVPFLPVARAIFDGDTLIGVVSLVVTPSRLLQQSRWNDCIYCYVEILRADQQTLTAYPSNADRPKDFLAQLRLQSESGSGYKRTTFHALPAKTSWIKNQDYPLITVYSEIEPN